MSKGIPCTWMRGGISKGAYFLMNVAMKHGALEVSRAAVLRTARKLFEGRVFPGSVRQTPR